MRKSGGFLLLSSLIAVAFSGAACPGPLGPTGPVGSPGPTGPSGNQGATGNIGSIPSNSFFRHIVVSSTNGNNVSMSADMIEVQNNFFGPITIGPLTTQGISPPMWAYVLALANGTASTGAAVSGSTNPITGYTAARPIGRIYYPSAAPRLSRQVDRMVTYLPPGPATGTLTSATYSPVDLSTFAPPGVRHVFVRSVLTASGGPATLSWSVDGVNGDVLAACAAGALATATCATDGTILLDGSQRFFYKVSGGGSVVFTVTGYVDETL